jgi:hypothetical protein
MKSVKLKSVSITNYKNIAKLSQEVNGNHFIVFGKNGQGKTSLMEVINRSALRIEPKDMADIPIKLGAKNAQTGIIYSIDNDGKQTEILVETVFRPSGAVMRVIDLSNNGELKPAAERLLSLLGESHDVSPLAEMDGKEQFKFLLKVLGGSQANTNFEDEFKEKYAERKVLNKQINAETLALTQKEPTLEVMNAYRTKGEYTIKKDLPKQPEKGDLLVEQHKIINHNEKVERSLKAREEIKAEIAKLQARLSDADKWLEENAIIDLTEINGKLASFDDSLVQYKDELMKVKQFNETVDAIQEYLANKKRIDEIVSNRDNIQKEMDGINAKMKESVSSLNIEELVPELKLVNEVDEDGNVKQGLFYKLEDGLLPFNRRQISYGKVLVALLKLSSYINAGKLNIFHIPAFESLDDESRSELLAFAKENDDLNLQFCIEEVKQELLGIKLIENGNKE